MSTMLPRILFTIPNFITAGSGQALLNIVERLDRSRFAPAVCVLKRGGNLAGAVEALGLPLLEAPFTVAPHPLTGLPGRIWEAAGHFRPYGFHLWHSFHYLDDYTEPLIARAAGTRAWVYTKKNMSWGGRGWWVRTRLASRIAAQNRAMLDGFFSHPAVRRKVRLIPRGVDAERFRPGTLPRLAIRRRLGLGRETVIVGCVAHLVRLKGQRTLIQALARVPDAHLVLAGKPLDAAYAAELRQLGTELRVEARVHFVGHVTDVAALHAELDIFVLPTLVRAHLGGEGCPVALLEAMASGLPCVATDVPGSQDLIEPGRSGLLVPPEDPAALARAICELCASAERRQMLGRAARQRILDHYTIEREVARHEALYAELLRL